MKNKNKKPADIPDSQEEREQMILEAALILNSIEWVTKKMNEIDQKIDNVGSNGESPEEIMASLTKYKAEITDLIRKAELEDKNIEAFIKKYKPKS
jgi:hypothetical protein